MYLFPIFLLSLVFYMLLSYLFRHIKHHPIFDISPTCSCKPVLINYLELFISICIRIRLWLYTLTTIVIYCILLYITTDFLFYLGCKLILYYAVYGIFIFLLQYLIYFLYFLYTWYSFCKNIYFVTLYTYDFFIIYFLLTIFIYIYWFISSRL